MLDHQPPGAALTTSHAPSHPGLQIAAAGSEPASRFVGGLPTQPPTPPAYKPLNLSEWLEAQAASAMIARAFQLANATAVADIRGYACVVHIGGQTWHDLRPMTDPREHSPEHIDMATLAIVHAIKAGLVQRHPDPDRAYLVRIVERPGHDTEGAHA